jgi:hypothetical protein
VNLAAFTERMAKLRVLRELAGAPMAVCDRALKACGGDVKAAIAHPEVRAARGVDGDPRHRCRDDCPPWRFEWRGSDHRGHLCSTHCRQHPDPRERSREAVHAITGHAMDAIDGVLRICDWDMRRTLRFFCEAGGGSWWQSR